MKNWRTKGNNPDYRFSLANERTFLAWMRTTLALLAGAIAVDQFATELADPFTRSLIGAAISLCAAFVAFYAYRRWRQIEQAMRQEQDLPYGSSLKYLSILMGLLAVLFCYLIVF